MKNQLGQRVWIHTPTGRDAAPGWPAGHLATVIAFVEPNFVTVRDDAGRELTLPHYEVLAGYEFRNRGPWVPETDPRVLDQLEKDIVKYSNERWQPAVERDRLATIESHKEILHRNGRPWLNPTEQTETPASVANAVAQ